MKTESAISYQGMFRGLMKCVNHKPLPKEIIVENWQSHHVQQAVALFLQGLGSVYHTDALVGANIATATLHLTQGAKVPQRHIKAHLPAGIGDIAWVMQKLQNALGPNGTCELLISGEGPKRGKEFAELYPCVTDVKYSQVGYQAIHKQRHHDSWTLEFQFDNDKEIYLSANSHLELGNRIEQYLPHYPTRYGLDNLNLGEYKGPIMNMDHYCIGIYPSSYKTNSNWNCGTPQLWLERMKAMEDHFIGDKSMTIVFYLIGAKFDRRFASEIGRLAKETGLNIVNTVGMLHIKDTIQMIKQLDRLIAFPSGIGIIGSMVKTPTLMIMPEHLKSMEYKWVHPKLIVDNQFVHLQLSEVNKHLIDVACNKLQDRKNV